MKKLVIIIAVIICFSCSTDNIVEYPADDCEPEYANLIEELKSTKENIGFRKGKVSPAAQKGITAL